MATPMDPYAGMDPKLKAAMLSADKTLAAGKQLATRGTVTGPPVQGSVAPLAPTAPAPPQPVSPWQHFLNWLGIGTPPAAKAQAKSLSAGAAYVAGGGKQRTAGVNNVIDEASR